MKKNYFVLLILIFAVKPIKSQVIFEYDEAGNQIFRGLEGTNKSAKPNLKAENSINNNESMAKIVANKIKVAPVPVKTDLNVIWEQEIHDYIIKIDLLPYNAFRILETVSISNLKTNSYIFKMGNLPYGVYFLKFYLSDGSVYNVTVTKN